MQKLASCDLILLCAGSSERFGSDKMMYSIDGVSLFERSLSSFVDFDFILNFIIVCSDSNIIFLESICKNHFSHLFKRIHFVAGGSSRAASSFAGLKKSTIISESEAVLVSDGDRCFTSSALIRRLYEGYLQYGNAVPVIKHPETFKEIRDGKIIAEFKKDDLYEIQTPQVFSRIKLIEAFGNLDGNASANDESALYFARFKDERINMVTGERSNIKVTYPEDILTKY